MLLSGISGFEVCRRIRRHRRLYTQPILLLSPVVDDEEVEHGLAQGADVYCAKSSDIKALSRQVEVLLDANAACLEPDPLTGIMGPQRMRREIQCRISRHAPFALVYGELLELPAFAARYGAAARDKAVTWMARAFAQRMEDRAAGGYLLAHMGIGHFVCMLNPEDADFCQDRLRVFCQEQLQGLYESLNIPMPGVASADEESGSSGVRIDVLLCITQCLGRDAHDPGPVVRNLVATQAEGSDRPPGRHACGPAGGVPAPNRAGLISCAIP